MKPYLVKTPKFVQRLFPKRVWAFSNKKNSVFLTFDDGPIPEVTPWVVNELKKYGAKATFFCIGDNIQKYPEVFQLLINQGHTIGNHTFQHLKGSKTKTEVYIQDVVRTEEVIRQSDKLFRPPYGKLSSKQSKNLQKKGFKIVMWDVLSADFDTSISEEKCLQNVLKNIEDGSIIVFHDSLKARKKLEYTLPKVLEFIAEKGWKCEAIL